MKQRIRELYKLYTSFSLFSTKRTLIVSSSTHMVVVVAGWGEGERELGYRKKKKPNTKPGDLEHIS